MQNSSDGMIITDENNEIREVNEAIINCYGYNREELIGENPRILASKEYKKDFYEKMWDDINNKSNWSGEIINQKKNGTTITQWISITALHDENNLAHNYLAMFTDLTKLKDAQNQMEFMAYHDPLTKLYNKSYLET
jgi:PAS domain S-box-containing protein